MQSAGSALRIPSAALRDAIARSPSLHALLLRFAHAFMVQGSHAAIAAGRARIDERLARGLLMWQDRLRADEWLVTHEFLALLMGVRRQGVTVALHELEGKGLIRSTRNRVVSSIARVSNAGRTASTARRRRVPPAVRRQTQPR